MATATIMGLAAMGGRRRLEHGACHSDICRHQTEFGQLPGKYIDTQCEVDACDRKLSVLEVATPVVTLDPFDIVAHPCEACDGFCFSRASRGIDSSLLPRCAEDSDCAPDEYCISSKGNGTFYPLTADNHPNGGNVVESTVKARDEAFIKQLHLPADSHIPGFLNNQQHSQLELSEDNVLTVRAVFGSEYDHGEHACSLWGTLTVTDDEHTSTTFQPSVPCDTCENDKGEHKSSFVTKSISSDTLENYGSGTNKKLEVTFDLKAVKRTADLNKEIGFYDRTSIGKLRIESDFELRCSDTSQGKADVTYPLQTKKEQGRRLGRGLGAAKEIIPLDYTIMFESTGKCDYVTETATLEWQSDPAFKVKSEKEYVTTFSPKSIIKFSGIRFPQGENAFEEFTHSDCQPQGAQYTLTCDWQNADPKASVLPKFSEWFSENDADTAVDGTGAHTQNYANPEPSGCSAEGVCTFVKATASDSFDAKLGFEVPLTEVYYEAKPFMSCQDPADVPSTIDKDSGAPATRDEAEQRKLFLAEGLTVAYDAKEILQDTIVSRRFGENYGDAYCADSDECEAGDSEPIARIFQPTAGESDELSKMKVTLLEASPVLGDFIDLTTDNFTQFGETSWSCAVLLHVSGESEASCDNIPEVAANSGFVSFSPKLIGVEYDEATSARSSLDTAYEAWKTQTHVDVPKDYEIEFSGYQISLVDRNGENSKVVEVDASIKFRERSESLRLKLEVSGTADAPNSVLSWSGSSKDTDTKQFDSFDEAWESPQESGAGSGDNRGLFLVDECRFCVADFNLETHIDAYDVAGKEYAYDSSDSSFTLFKSGVTGNFNGAYLGGEAHPPAVCAQKSQETGQYDSSTYMCYSDTLKQEGGEPVFLNTHAYDCLASSHRIKVSLRKSTGDKRVQEDFVEVFKTYARDQSGGLVHASTGVAYEKPVPAVVTSVRNVEVGTKLDAAFQLPNSVTQAGVISTDLVFFPQSVDTIGYTCDLSEAESKTPKTYEKTYFHPCTNEPENMEFDRPVRGLYSERQARREVTRTEDWSIREWDLERGTQTFSFQVSAPYKYDESGNRVTIDGVSNAGFGALKPTVTFNHPSAGSGVEQTSAACIVENDGTQTCSFRLSAIAIDGDHTLASGESCGQEGEIECPTIKVHLKTNIATPFAESDHAGALAVTGGAFTDAFYDIDSSGSGGTCGGTKEIKLPVTDSFGREEVFPLKVEGNDNSYDQVVKVRARTGSITSGASVEMAQSIVHDPVVHSTGKDDELDTEMTPTGFMDGDGNEILHLRIEFDKAGNDTKVYEIKLPQSAEYESFVCSQQAFTSECEASGASRTITLEKLSTTHLFVGVKKKHASDVCENRMVEEDAFARSWVAGDKHHFKFTVRDVNDPKDALAHTFRVPLRCPQENSMSDGGKASLESFGGIRPSSESPGHRQVKSAVVSNFVAYDFQEKLYANGQLLAYTRDDTGRIIYVVKDIYQEQMSEVDAGGDGTVGSSCVEGVYTVKFSAGSPAEHFGDANAPCVKSKFNVFRVVVGENADARILEEGGLVPNRLLVTDGDEFRLKLQIVADDSFAGSACTPGRLWPEQGIDAPGYVSSSASLFQRSGAGAECAAATPDADGKRVDQPTFKLHADADGERCHFALITLSEPSASSGGVPRFAKFRVQCPRVDEDANKYLVDKLRLNYGIESAHLSLSDLKIELAPKGQEDVTERARFGGTCVTGSEMVIEDGSFCDLTGAIGNDAFSKQGSPGEVLQSVVNCGGATEAKTDAAGVKTMAVSVDVKRQQTRSHGVFKTQRYCGLSKLEFMYQTTATTSTTIVVDSPKDRVYAVGINDLKYALCEDGVSYHLEADILVQHKPENGEWEDAGADVRRANEVYFGWENGEPDVVGGIQDGVFKIKGRCQPPPSAETCPSYETTRMMGFSLQMKQNEIYYTGRAALEMRLDCPINQDVALAGTEDDAVKLFSDEELTVGVSCPPAGSALTDAECADKTLIPADSNIVVSIDVTEEEKAAFQHTYSEPTVKIGGDTMPASSLDGRYRAVVANSEKIDLLAQNNRVLQLRALPMAGKGDIVISWEVERVAPTKQRRQLLQVSYTLGSDGSVKKSTSIGVLPAARNSEEASATKYTEEVVKTNSDGTTDEFNRTVTTDQPTEEKAGGMGITIAFSIIGGLGLIAGIVAIVMAATGKCKTQVSGSVYSDYAPVSQVAGWQRDRFKPDWL